MPWWTWVLPIVFFQLGTRLSLVYQIAPGLTTFYFPIAFAFVMIRWWGYRVLPALFINATLSAGLFGVTKLSVYPLIGLVDVLEAWASYILVKERFKGVKWSPTPTNLVIYGIHGLLIPALVAAIFQQAILFTTGYATSEAIVWQGLSAFIGDVMTGVGISIPAIIILTPYLEKKNLSKFPIESFDLDWRWKMPLKEKVILASGMATALVVGLTVPIFRIWYFVGIFILLPAIWYGLECAMIVNTMIGFLTLAYPAIAGEPWPRTSESLQIVATLLTLSFSALVAGSAVTYHRKKILQVVKTENELKIAKEQAEEASRAKSDFLARMSHEIRTPLNSVLGMLELLRETNLSKDQERYLTLFSHAGENLKALINDLLDFSKIEAKALSIENISYNIHSTIRSVFEILQIKAEEKGLHFELDIDNSVPLFQIGDPTRLRQVLFNLIGNALKFTEEGEVLTKVSVEKGNPDKLVIEVRDTGIGIPRDKQQSLFSPFTQGESTINRKYGGTGLGLVISKNLVEIMGGDIELRSLAGRGTTFRITLPHRPDVSGPQEKIQATPIKWPEYFGNKRFKLLLVDDSEDNRLLITHYLKNLPFEITDATNGKEAVEKFKQEKFDVVFMDMQMPIMSGYKATEIIRHIEKENGLKRTCIIALTATAVLEELQRTLTSGCDRYMVKPVKKAEVVECLVQALTTKVPDSEAFREPPSPNI